MNKVWLNYYKWRLLNPIITCALCDIPSSLPICNHCFTELESNNSINCRYCAKPGKNICYDCESNQPIFSHTYCNYLYQTPLNRLLYQLKYHLKTKNVWALGYILNKTLTRIKPDTDIIIPMPISKERFQQRGFNQTQKILNYYQVKSGKIPVISNLVKKVNNTPQLAKLNKEERLNIKLDFRVTRNITGKNILIVDDVITTGFTANQLALALKKQGANRIELCTLMRSV